MARLDRAGADRTRLDRAALLLSTVSSAFPSARGFPRPCCGPSCYGAALETGSWASAAFRWCGLGVGLSGGCREVCREVCRDARIGIGV